MKTYTIFLHVKKNYAYTYVIYFQGETFWEKVAAIFFVFTENRPMWIMYYYGSELMYEVWKY